MLRKTKIATTELTTRNRKTTLGTLIPFKPKTDSQSIVQLGHVLDNKHVRWRVEKVTRSNRAVPDLRSDETQISIQKARMMLAPQACRPPEPASISATCQQGRLPDPPSLDALQASRMLGLRSRPSDSPLVGTLRPLPPLYLGLRASRVPGSSALCPPLPACWGAPTQTVRCFKLCDLRTCWGGLAPQTFHLLGSFAQHPGPQLSQTSHASRVLGSSPSGRQTIRLKALPPIPLVVSGFARFARAGFRPQAPRLLVGSVHWHPRRFWFCAFRACLWDSAQPPRSPACTRGPPHPRPLFLSLRASRVLGGPPPDPPLAKWLRPPSPNPDPPIGQREMAGAQHRF